MISVVIPLYNKVQAIPHTLDSVLAQTYDNYEIVIVDDGSTDGSSNLVDSYKKTHSKVNIRIFHRENQGVCATRNFGVQMAKGDYVAFLDADDLWDKEYLEEADKLIRNYPEAAMWGINYAETHNGHITRVLPTGLSNDFRGYIEDYFRMPHRSSDLFTSSSTILRKEQFLQVGGFDERIKYAEDLDLWWRMVAEFPCAFSQRVLAYYQQDTENRVDRGLTTPNFRYYFPYYVGKYKKYKNINRDFYHYIEQVSAYQITRYCFTVPEDYADAKSVIKDLDFSAVTFKYRLMLKSPYLIGKIIYNFINLLKKI